MIDMRCSVCGCLLRHKQIVYEDEMNKLCTELNIDYNAISIGIVDGDNFDSMSDSDTESETKKEKLDYKTGRKKIVEKLCAKLCCRAIMLTYLPIVDIIKGEFKK